MAGYDAWRLGDERPMQPFDEDDGAEAEYEALQAMRAAEDFARAADLEECRGDYERGRDTDRAEEER